MQRPSCIRRGEEKRNADSALQLLPAFGADRRREQSACAVERARVDVQRPTVFGAFVGQARRPPWRAHVGLVLRLAEARLDGAVEARFAAGWRAASARARAASA